MSRFALPHQLAGLLVWFPKAKHCIISVFGHVMITSRTFVLAVVGVVWKVSGRPPTSTPVEPTLLGIKLKFCIINYLVSEEADKVYHLQPFGGHLGDGVKYTLLGAFLN